MRIYAMAAVAISALSCSKKETASQGQAASAAGSGGAHGSKASKAAGGGAGGDTATPKTRPPPLNVTFTSPLAVGQAAHDLYQPGAPNVPHPFYKAQCAKMPPPTDYKNAGGVGTYTFDPKTKTLRYKIQYSGLSGPPIMAHFHKGAVGVSGPIVQTICGHPPPGNKKLGFSAPAVSGAHCPAGTSGTLEGSYPLQGNAELTPALTAEAEEKLLLGGVLYVNIHTCLNEAGELRGQIVRDENP